MKFLNLLGVLFVIISALSGLHGSKSTGSSFSGSHGSKATGTTRPTVKPPIIYDAPIRKPGPKTIGKRCENGYPSRRRSLVDDARFESLVVKQNKQIVLEEARNKANDGLEEAITQTKVEEVPTSEEKIQIQDDQQLDDVEIPEDIEQDEPNFTEVNTVESTQTEENTENISSEETNDVGVTVDHHFYDASSMYFAD
uniref:Uncharacterized protein n=1 Tax=Glossina brevipalpis TaxID=37001 RepID=A0A1A9WRC1_9MUSC